MKQATNILTKTILYPRPISNRVAKSSANAEAIKTFAPYWPVAILLVAWPSLFIIFNSALISSARQGRANWTSLLLICRVLSKRLSNSIHEKWLDRRIVWSARFKFSSLEICWKSLEPNKKINSIKYWILPAAGLAFHTLFQITEPRALIFKKHPKKSDNRARYFPKSPIFGVKMGEKPFADAE